MKIEVITETEDRTIYSIEKTQILMAITEKKMSRTLIVAGNVAVDRYDSITEKEDIEKELDKRFYDAIINIAAYVATKKINEKKQ